MPFQFRKKSKRIIQLHQWMVVCAAISAIQQQLNIVKAANSTLSSTLMTSQQFCKRTSLIPKLIAQVL